MSWQESHDCSRYQAFLKPQSRSLSATSSATPATAAISISPSAAAEQEGREAQQGNGGDGGGVGVDGGDSGDGGEGGGNTRCLVTPLVARGDSQEARCGCECTYYGTTDQVESLLLHITLLPAQSVASSASSAATAEPLANSPLTFALVPGAVSAGACSIGGTALTLATAGELTPPSMQPCAPCACRRLSLSAQACCLAQARLRCFVSLPGTLSAMSKLPPTTCSSRPSAPSLQPAKAH